MQIQNNKDNYRQIYIQAAAAFLMFTCINQHNNGNKEKLSLHRNQLPIQSDGEIIGKS